MRWIFLLNLARLAFKARELGIDFIITTFYRSEEDEIKEFSAGRSETLHSLHTRWLAVDIALWDDVDQDGVVDQGEIMFKDDPRYTTLGQFWESLGGVWGGRWKQPHDIFHFEYSGNLKS